MAKKKTTTRSSSETTGFTRVCAFIALTASAILMLIGPIVKWLLDSINGSVVMQVLNMAAQYCLLVAIAIPAWAFVRGRSKGWKIAYFVFLAIYIASTILGVTLGI